MSTDTGKQARRWHWWDHGDTLCGCTDGLHSSTAFASPDYLNALEAAAEALEKCVRVHDEAGQLSGNGGVAYQARAALRALREH